MSTTTVFTSLLRVNILDNTLGLSPTVHERLCTWLRMGADYALEVVWFVLLAAAILLKYQAAPARSAPRPCCSARRRTRRVRSTPLSRPKPSAVGPWSTACG
ncbi:hypothetical protein [Georgenia sp. SUBG003]|uniref:hypothetical protein n=1 Tax=Georgenia sp. SUBG003 TaxID=1497974 RepID=UPI003AB339AA